MEATGAQADPPAVRPAFGRGLELMGDHAIGDNGKTQDEQVTCSGRGLMVELWCSHIPRQSLVPSLNQAGGNF